MRTLPVGQALVRAGVITLEQAADAAAAQRAVGGQIGQHLILAGAVTRRDMYAALATQWRAPIIDLLADPPDPALVTGEPHEVVARGWVPCSLEDDVAVVATSVPPTGERLLNMRQATGATTIVLRTATDWDVFQCVADVRRRQLLDAPEPPVDLVGAPRPSGADRLVRRLVVPALLVVVVATGLVRAPWWTLAGLLVVVEVLLVAGTLLRLALGWRTARARASRATGDDGATRRRRDGDLPVYSVLVPCRAATAGLLTLVDDLDAQDYPLSKLEVLLLVAEDAPDVLAALKSSRPPAYMTILRVPAGPASSDAFACNYGLAFARGAFVVAYRSGDSPDGGQLAAAVDAFMTSRRRGGPGESRDRVACVQTTTVHDAPTTLAGRVSALERAAWFGDVLPTADAWGIPTPLGRSSEHFDTHELRAVGAWDPDDRSAGADLATRLRAARRRVATIPSTTTTRPPADLSEWADERTRWITGCLLTTWAGLRGSGDARRVPAGLAGSAMLVTSPLGFTALPLALTSVALLALLDRSPGLAVPPGLPAVLAVWPFVAFVVMALVSGRAAARTYGWSAAAGAAVAPVSWLLQIWPTARAAVRLAARPVHD
ncbi:glycosyltransferase [Aeromicrobium sp. Root472D3]|uniref:glycosyltransferase n=1 Tax=Aeromicrobium sp. Root472D3 TaxID=1736540 RepID=UPI0006FC7637|nr:glycosyltransferase [Aeromicrobium sp. Root472D3]KQX75834.1 hypothetical protein ASD10_12000 [Aeromicrobium sp. Root472D3]